MPLSDFQFVASQPVNEVWLTCTDGAQTYLVSIRRTDVNDFAQQGQLSWEQQNDLVRRNLETLVPVIEAKKERGELGPTVSATGRIMTTIELTRVELEQGMRRYRVVSKTGMGLGWEQAGTDTIRRAARPPFDPGGPVNPPTPLMPAPQQQPAQHQPVTTPGIFSGEGRMTVGENLSRSLRPKMRLFLILSEHDARHSARSDIDSAVSAVRDEVIHIDLEVMVESLKGADLSEISPVNHVYNLSNDRAFQEIMSRPSVPYYELLTIIRNVIFTQMMGRSKSRLTDEYGISILNDLVESSSTGIPLVARDGRIDLAPGTADYEQLAPRIQAAKQTTEDLIVACMGSNQHAPLRDFARQGREELEKIKPGDTGLCWFVVAQKVETYRTNYVAYSKQDPIEYPPLEPALSTLIDTVVLASGMLARLFPEIAKSQDDFERYSGRQVGVHRAQRELLDAALSDLARSGGVLTTRAADVTKAIAELDPGATPEDAPEMARAVATKSGWLRGFFTVVTRLALDQVGYLRENIRTKGLYDVSKEIVKGLSEHGFGGTLALLAGMTPYLHSLAAQWPAMFDFLSPLLRLLGL